MPPQLICVLNCCRVISNLLQVCAAAEQGAPPGADDFLPLLIFVVIKAAVPQVAPNPRPQRRCFDKILRKRARALHWTHTQSHTHTPQAAFKGTRPDSYPLDRRQRHPVHFATRRNTHREPRNTKQCRNRGQMMKARRSWQH